MPVNDTARKYLSDVVKGANTHDNSNAMQFNYGSLTVTSAFTVETLGIPVVWDTSGATFVVYTDATAAELALGITAGDSPLPGGAVVAVLVGTAFGLGFNSADVDYTAGVVATAFHRGANNAGVVRSGIDYLTAATSGGNQTIFEDQLEAQGIMVIDNADAISPTYTS
jgi:hypothetical protein